MKELNGKYTWEDLVSAMPNVTRQKYLNNLYDQNNLGDVRQIELTQYTDYHDILSGSFVFTDTTEGIDYWDEVIIFLDEVVLPNVGKTKVEVPKIKFDFLHN